MAHFCIIVFFLERFGLTSSRFKLLALQVNKWVPFSLGSFTSSGSLGGSVSLTRRSSLGEHKVSPVGSSLGTTESSQYSQESLEDEVSIRVNNVVAVEGNEGDLVVGNSREGVHATEENTKGVDEVVP